MEVSWKFAVAVFALFVGVAWLAVQQKEQVGALKNELRRCKGEAPGKASSESVEFTK